MWVEDQENLKFSWVWSMKICPALFKIWQVKDHLTNPCQTYIKNGIIIVFVWMVKEMDWGVDVDLNVSGSIAGWKPLDLSLVRDIIR